MPTVDEQVAVIREGARIANRHRHPGTVLAAVADLLTVIADGGQTEWAPTRAAAVTVAEAIGASLTVPPKSVWWPAKPGDTPGQLLPGEADQPATQIAAAPPEGVA